MFDAPGRKIQGLAKTIFAFLAALPVIIGSFFILGSLFGDASFAFFILGIVIIVVGIGLAWVSSIALYAFGELVEDTEEIRSNTEITKTYLENIYDALKNNPQNQNPTL